MNQTERISYMEKILDESQASVSELSVALEKYVKLIPRMKELIAYYESRQWLHDFVDDSLGKIPKDLKRGVLSEDSVYDLISENAELIKKIESIKISVFDVKINEQ